MPNLLHLAVFVAVLFAHLWFSTKLGGYCWRKLRDGASYSGAILSAFVLLGCIGYFIGSLIFFFWLGMFMFAFPN
ncbi:MAG: hypothetical protein ACRER5_19695 [Pseudomonas sp.]